MYVGICKEIGKTVSDEEAFDYAFDRCMKGTEKEDKKYYTGLQERTEVYDYSNAESLDDLISKGKKRLRERMGIKSMKMKVQEANLQIGDIIAGRNYENGMYLQKPVVQKIVRVENGIIEIQHKVEGEE